MSTAQVAEEMAPELSEEASREFFDQQVQMYMGIGRQEFLQKLEAGELDKDEPRVSHLILLLPFAR
ncbi:MAG TPA: hypothetical protein VF221_01390 [Chloroflexota bacterium]